MAGGASGARRGWALVGFARVVACGLAVGVCAGLIWVDQPEGVEAAGSPSVPGTGCPMFPTDNVWNTPITGLPVHPRSAQWLAATGAAAGRLLHPDFGGPPYGIPFNVVRGSHATAMITFDYAGESDPPGPASTKGPYPFGPDLQIEQGSDAHLLTVDQDTCRLYEIYAANAHGPATAGSGAIFDLRSDALRPAGWTSADAAGLPILPGLVRLDEVAAGAIRHAIRFTVQRTDRSYLWPARHQAGAASDPTLPPMGARFRLRSDFNLAPYGAAARAVLVAMQTYGLIVADNGSNWYFQGTEDPGWNAAPYAAMIAQLKSVPASAFEAVDESSLMVSPNSAQARRPSGPPPPPPIAAPTTVATATAAATRTPGAGPSGPGGPGSPRPDQSGVASPSPSPRARPARGAGCFPAWLQR